MSTIDINSDLGEGIGNDEAIMPYITSCNIACGGHAGDLSSMQETLLLAQQYKVKIGAHPSFPDRENFGRKTMHLSDSELKESILSQVSALSHAAGSLGLSLHHIKPHGALYNQAAKDPALAKTIVGIIKDHFKELTLFAPPGSALLKEGKQQGITVWTEVFADRNYREDLSLVPRSEANAVIHEEKEVLSHLKNMFCERKVKTINHQWIPITADTICVHGDNPHAVSLARNIYNFIHGTLQS